MAKAAIDLSYQQRPFNRDLRHVLGENGLPLVGCSLELTTKPYQLVDRLYKTYGPVARMQVLNQPVLVCSGAEINRMVYLDPDKNFSAMMGYHESLNEFYTGGLLVRDFDEHKLHRRMFQTAFKNETMRHYTALMNQIIAQNIAGWGEQRDFHFFPNIKSTLMDIAARTFLGIDDLVGDEARRIAKTYEHISEGMVGIIRADSPLLPFCKWRRGKVAKRYMERYLIEQIPARRAGNKQDMFSLVCREKNEQGEYFSDADIAGHINFLLFAAHDTTTSNLSYIMQLLGQFPDIQQKARNECLALGKPFVEFDDLNNMHELEKIHLEALRLYPSVMTMVRRTIRECEIEGVRVPADTFIYVYPQYVHRMPEYWDNPEVFDPERFSPGRAEHKRHPFQFIPFGGGAHKCIGMHFAGMIVKTFMHQMLLAYEWQVPEGYNPVHQIFPMPKQKDDLPLLLTRR